jgi:hypothetical protein
MIEIGKISSGSLALVVWNLDKQNDVHVYLGKLHKTHSGFEFRNDEKGWIVEITPEMISDIKEVGQGLKSTLLDADYFLNLSMGDLVDEKGNYTPTGLRWH